MQPGKISAEELDAFLADVFPQLHIGGKVFFIEAVGHGEARLRMKYHERYLRPGGTISGPAMFTLADLALYAATIASIGPVALAVTTNLSINFLKKPAQHDLIGHCRLLKLGKRLAVGEVSMMSDGSDELVAHATGTYSIPDR